METAKAMSLEMSASGVIRQIVLIALFVFLLFNSLRIGYYLSGDVHSGGHLIGIPIVLTICVAITKLIFFDKAWRSLSSIFVRAIAIALAIVFIYVMFAT